MSLLFSLHAASRPVALRMAMLAGVTLVALSGPAAAQVTTNSGALDSVAPAKKTAARAPVTHVTHHTSPAHHQKTAAPVHSSATQAPSPKPAIEPATPARPARPVPAATIPAAPPPPPVFTAPHISVELHPFPMPPDPPAEDGAAGNAVPLEGGIRITFAADSAKLNTETRTAILAVAQSLKEKPETRALVDATASGAANDPSRPRRMALSRGLAVRAVLMNAGIPSTRIYVRVIGPAEKTGIATPADRVDIRRSDAVP